MKISDFLKRFIDHDTDLLTYLFLIQKSSSYLSEGLHNDTNWIKEEIYIVLFPYIVFVTEG